MGVDYVIELDFRQYKHLSAEQFLRDIVVENFHPSYIVTGRNYKFGNSLEGDFGFLKANEEKYNYSYIDIFEETFNSNIINSREIKDLIISFAEHNDALKATLGGNFSLYNSVVKGEHRSSSFCFPTANVIWPENIVKLPYGVYLGYCQTDKKSSLL